MKRRPLITRSARTDLLHIWNYLAEYASFDTADRVLRDLQVAIRSLASHPELGHRRDDLTNKNVKFYRVHSYLIVYLPDPTPICVARVLHASRDIESIVGDAD